MMQNHACHRLTKWQKYEVCTAQIIIVGILLLALITKVPLISLTFGESYRMTFCFYKFICMAHFRHKATQSELQGQQEAKM